ncbi:hypothetical protein ACROYT_G038161 [Oculina patagonica]
MLISLQMLLVTFLVWVALCVSHPLNDKTHHHPPVFDGTDKTLPENSGEDHSVTEQIEEINQDSGYLDKLFESDIKLTPQDYSRVDTSPTGDAEGADVQVASIERAEKRKAVRTRRKIWPSRIIPVVNYVDEARANVLEAMREIQKVSCVRFKDREDGDKHWVKIIKKNGCWSYIGREYNKPGAQELSIGDGCNTKGIIIHELMHALGFWHEQSRTDRDNYIAVMWENIKAGQERNFNRYPTQEVDYAGGMYDFQSIMHYGNYLFSKNRKMTMVALKNRNMLFGQQLRLSKTDILQLNAVYDCKTPSGGWSSWTDWGPCDRRCTMRRERFCAAKDRKKCPGVDSDGIQGQTKRCETAECNIPLNGHWGRWAAWSACSKTCDEGYQTRSRLCNDPPPQFNGNICEGVLVQVQMCKGNRPKCTSSSKVTNSGNWRKRTRTRLLENEKINSSNTMYKVLPDT